MPDEQLAYLADFLTTLNRAGETLRYSYDICSGIGIKTEYTEEEMDRFESLTSKFARLSDMIIKQAIKLIDILDLDEAPETIRDAINRAEKKGIISSAIKFVEIRKLRNLIAHEYAASPEEINAIYSAVFKNVPELFLSIERINRYAGKF